LFGAIIGVGVANSVISGHGWMAGVNWNKAEDIGKALVFSPVVGFVCSGLLLLLLKLIVRREDLYKAPVGKNPPPLWIRLCLIGTCTGVSYAHGSNDGQKGMGLIMLILVGLVPGAFALNMGLGAGTVQTTMTELRQVATTLQSQAGSTTVTQDDAAAELTDFIKPTAGKATEKTYAAIIEQSQYVAGALANVASFGDLANDQRTALRSDIYQIDESLGKLLKNKLITDPAAATQLQKTTKDLDSITKYIPLWVKVSVALALGLGTMIGWKRIVVTVGEKIGKAHLTYAQGLSAEIIAYVTIQAADRYALPVSTTHILSSGIAGTMAANGSGLQKDTLISILLAWVLTLPVCIFLGATLFSAALYVTLHVFGIK
jgi:PiT family inorganic phosphate transporter